MQKKQRDQIDVGIYFVIQKFSIFKGLKLKVVVKNCRLNQANTVEIAL